MRRRFAIALVLLLGIGTAGACGDDDGTAFDADGDGIVDRDRPLPDDVQQFVDRIAPDVAELDLALTYSVLNKNGGDEHVVEVASPPLVLRVDGEEVAITDDARLSSFGIFSGFLAANPKAAIEAAARRADAGDALFTTRGEMDCIAVPVGGTSTSTWCLLDVGVFGYVDTPSVRYEVQ